MWEYIPPTWLKRAILLWTLLIFREFANEKIQLLQPQTVFLKLNLNCFLPQTLFYISSGLGHSEPKLKHKPDNVFLPAPHTQNFLSSTDCSV